jgi:uncharacterized protein (TIGR03790 family)
MARRESALRAWLWSLLPLAGLLLSVGVNAEILSADRLGVVYNLDDETGRDVALYYAQRRLVPSDNVIGVHLPRTGVISPETFASVRAGLLSQLPTSVQSLLLVWSKPWAVGCMSITTAFAAGYRPEFCVPGCGETAPNPLFNSQGWLPADTIGWWPAMLLPTDDKTLAKDLIDRGIAADFGSPHGILYLVRTSDAKRNVRAASYGDVEADISPKLQVVELRAPVSHAVLDAIGYFTGTSRVDELPLIQFRPGALADHLTSTGGVLAGGVQMPAIAWIAQGATATYGTVTEPCNLPEKFPDIDVLFRHYMQGETALEAYWKSVAMPGQGLFIGEPLARPFAPHVEN